MDVKLKVVSLWAENVFVTAHFYRDVIGLRLMPHHGDRPHFDLGGIYLTLVEGQPAKREADSPENFPVLAFVVEDLEAAMGRLRTNGVDFPWGIEEAETTHWVKFYDPAGNLIELVDHLP